MNIHLPAILRFTRGTRFWPIPTSCCHPLPAAARSSTSISRGTIRIPLHKWGYWPQVGVRKWMGTCGNPFKVSWHVLAWSSRVVANSDYAFFWTLAIGCTHQLTRQTYRDIRETTCWGNSPLLWQAVRYLQYSRPWWLVGDLNRSCSDSAWYPTAKCWFAGGQSWSHEDSCGIPGGCSCWALCSSSVLPADIQSQP